MALTDKRKNTVSVYVDKALKGKRSLWRYRSTVLMGYYSTASELLVLIELNVEERPVVSHHFPASAIQPRLGLNN